MSRYARRLSSVDSIPIESKRFLMVPSLSSAARIPLPGATSARAISLSSLIRPPCRTPAYSRISAVEGGDCRGQDVARASLEAERGSAVERGRPTVDDADAAAG